MRRRASPAQGQIDVATDLERLKAEYSIAAKRLVSLQYDIVSIFVRLYETGEYDSELERYRRQADIVEAFTADLIATVDRVLTETYQE